MPARPGESVFGSTSFVHVRPPPTRFTKRSAGSWTRRRIPLASFLRILKRADSSLLGFTPPPQRRVPRFASSARLAFIAAGPERREPVRGTAKPPALFHADPAQDPAVARELPEDAQGRLRAERLADSPRARAFASSPPARLQAAAHSSDGRGPGATSLRRVAPASARTRARTSRAGSMRQRHDRTERQRARGCGHRESRATLDAARASRKRGTAASRGSANVGRWRPPAAAACTLAAH